MSVRVYQAISCDYCHGNGWYHGVQGAQPCTKCEGTGRIPVYDMGIPAHHWRKFGAFLGWVALLVGAVSFVVWLVR